VRDFRQPEAPVTALSCHAGIHIHGSPGVLKNALDGRRDRSVSLVMIGKPVLVMSVSPAFTGVSASHARVNGDPACAPGAHCPWSAGS